MKCPECGHQMELYRDSAWWVYWVCPNCGYEKDKQYEPPTNERQEAKGGKR